ncbi:methylenetetrahydrofolate reductase [Bdellovibrionota bacterium FG-2]
MNAFPFKPDRKLTDVLATDGFTISAEVIPPRNGSEQSFVLKQIQTLTQAGAQFLAVTKGAGGSLRGGSLPIAQAVKEQFGVPCIAHFTCRDLTAHDIENQLIDHHYFGIRNILALRGDPPENSPEWKPRDGGYSLAHELIAQIREMNAGRYIPRPGGPPSDGHEKTDFCIGAAVYPEFPDAGHRLEYFRKKVEAGAQYAITDMLFDPESYARFRERCDREGLKIPILPGTRLLKSRSVAEKMAARFKVSIPAATLAALPEGEGPEDKAVGEERGIELFLKLVEDLKRYGAPGVHFFVISDTPGAANALKRLASHLKQGIS